MKEKTKRKQMTRPYWEFPEDKTWTKDDTIEHAINDYGRQEFYGLFSGGKDSVTACHWFANNYPELFKGILFIDTTVGLKETKEFVINYCKEQNWPLFIRKPPRMDYETWVKKYGFPTMRIHTIVMRRLKYEAMRGFIREDIRIDKAPCLISGVRKKESQRRMKNVLGSVTKDGRLHFVAPLIDMSTEEVLDYVESNGLAISPVYSTLHLSGDCLCGCYAKKEELGLLKMFYPYMAEKLEKLEREVKESGVIPEEYCNWGNNTGFASHKQSIQEAMGCDSCANDLEVKTQDNKRFDDELSDIDKKLEQISKINWRKDGKQD